MPVVAKLEELMQLIPGAVGVGEFTDDGKLRMYSGNLKEVAADYAATMLSAVMALANAEAKGWDLYSGQEGFYPIMGFAVGAGKYVAMVMGNVAVFAELEKADLDKTFEILSKYV